MSSSRAGMALSCAVGIVFGFVASGSAQTGEDHRDPASAGLPPAGYSQEQVKESAVADDKAHPSGDDGWSDSLASQRLTPEEEGFRSEVERAWFQAEGGLKSRAEKARSVALSLGINNLDSAARALISAENPNLDLASAMLAVRLAPDLPVAHMALARVMWREGERLGAMGQAASAVRALLRNFEAMTWLVGSLLVMIAAVFIAAPLLFIVSVGVSVAGRASHDLGDLFVRQMPNFARATVLGVLLLLPMALGEGIMGLVMALFVLGFIYGSSRHRMALCLAVVLFMMGMYPVAHTAGTVLLALDTDPVATATLAVVQGVESAADIDLLEAESETQFLAKHVLALRARRLGRIEEAFARYSALLESSPRNPQVLTNLANLRFLTGDLEGAVELYERSAVITESAQLMFNLSQANARLFHIEEFESALRAAQKLDADMVADLSRLGDADFVADLGFPLSVLRSRFLTAAGRKATPQVAINFLMPGWLGRDWIHLAGSFGLLAVVSALLASRFRRASSCTRCGCRICARCDGTVWNSETCDGCHHLFHRPETTDPALRMKRLYELQARETRLGRIVLAVSLLIPGAGGLLARRPDLGFLGILASGFAAVFLVWHDGVVPDPLAVGSAGTLAFLIAGFVAILGYLLIVGAGLMIRRDI